MIPNTLKLTVTLDIKSKKDKRRSVANKVILVKNIEIIDNTNVYDTYKYFYLSMDGQEQRLLIDNLSANGLKV